MTRSSSYPAAAADAYRRLARPVRQASLGARLLAGVVLGLLVPGAALADDYRLGSQDRVRISVVEWTLDELRSPINGEFTISAAGSISLPLLGEVPAAGLPVAGLSAAISERLQAKLGLTEQPDTAVEIIQFRPFYILGGVDRPGEYAYRPGLTVLQALSLAGGLPRSETGRMQIERDLSTARADIHAARSGIDELSLREIRLAAELEGADSLVFPEAVDARKGEGPIAQMMESESLLFATRRSTVASEEEAIAKLGTLFEQEVTSLQEHARALQVQQGTVQRQIELFRSLKERGLGNAGRELELDRALSDVQSKQREVEAQAVRVQQEHVRANEAAERARHQRLVDLANELRQTRTSLAELRHRGDAAQRLLAVGERFSNFDVTPIYSIVREKEGRGEEIAANEMTPIAPGDVLKVRTEIGSPPPVQPAPQAPAEGEPVASEQAPRTAAARRGEGG